LAKLEDTNFWFRARNDLIIWAFNAYKPNAHSFLEVGCGTGFVLSGIAKAYSDMVLNGSEIFLDGLSYAIERVPTASFMQMDARRIPFLEEFDTIGAFDVLEHIDEDEVVLTQLYKALKPNGVLLLTVPQHPWLWSAADEYACHMRRYKAKELFDKIRRSGFKVLRTSSFVSLLLPAMLLSRFKRHQLNADYDAIAELSLPRILNDLFLFVMRLECWLIRLGLNFPIGGSRLLIAKKVS